MNGILIQQIIRNKYNLPILFEHDKNTIACITYTSFQAQIFYQANQSSIYLEYLEEIIYCKHDAITKRALKRANCWIHV